MTNDKYAPVTALHASTALRAINTGRTRSGIGTLSHRFIALSRVGGRGRIDAVSNRDPNELVSLVSEMVS